MIGEIQYGAFRGRRLVQKSGEIGGTRSVFVKIKGIKNELVYPTFGGKIMNPPTGQGFKMFAGDLCWYKTDANGVNPEIYLLKTYKVHSASDTTLHIVRDGFKHKPFVGQEIGVAPEEVGGAMTSVKITAVAEAVVSNVNVWTLTTDTALSASADDILVEAVTSDDNTKMLVEQINGVIDADIDLYEAAATSANSFEGARYYYTPALGGIMYIHKMSPMPACVLALNKCDIRGWFKVDGLAAQVVDDINAEVDAINAEVALLNQNGATAPTTSTKGVVGSTYTVTASGSEALYVCTAVGSGETPTYTWIKMFPTD